MSHAKQSAALMQRIYSGTRSSLAGFRPGDGTDRQRAAESGVAASDHWFAEIEQVCELIQQLADHIGVALEQHEAEAGKNLAEKRAPGSNAAAGELFNSLYNSCVTVHDAFETEYATRCEGRDRTELARCEAALRASRALVPGMHLLSAWLGIPLEADTAVATGRPATAPALKIVK